tara:strand:+ start:8880 stop:10667 length:1788 start_codon:yes stop_codon:yes gene_type:complete
MNKKIRVNDYIANFLEKKGIEYVFLVTGGGAMFLNDGIAKSNIKGVFNHHEQACAMSALGYTKSNNKVAVVMPTTGCGGTNTITGLLDAWQDSNKVVYISGNVKSKETTYVNKTPLRKFGVQEANIIKIVESITKYSVMITDPNTIAYHLEKAFYECENGRPGPVWIDVPLDIQSAFVEEKKLKHFEPDNIILDKPDLNEFKKLLEKSKRPVVIAGYGIQLSDTRNQFMDFIEKYNLPVTVTYLAIDLINSTHKNYVGRLGTKGDRAGNFAVQNADLIISLGSSLSVSVTGFQYEYFAREAKVIAVDIDINEHKKNTIQIDLEINCDLKLFFNSVDSINYFGDQNWINKTNSWRNKWPVFQKEYYKTEDGINMYLIINEISKRINQNHTVVSDAGSAYYVTSQSLLINNNAKYITSGAQADMGFTIPASIGVSLANKNGIVIGITGDGSFQMNIQELQTIVNYNLPIKIFVLNNGGYLSIRNTMDRFFDSRYFGTDESSGLKFPSTEKIANAYGIEYKLLQTINDINNDLSSIMESSDATIIEVICPFKQELKPSSSTKVLDDGQLFSPPLEEMYPFLDEEEMNKELIVKRIINK